MCLSSLYGVMKICVARDCDCGKGGIDVPRY